MTCYHPLTGYRSENLNPSGKRGIVFDRSKSSNGIPVPLPCGQCYGCRLEYSRQWAVRCVHESKQYVDNCFITLTYDDEHLPWDHSLNKRHFQLFMKKLRKEHGTKKIRFYHSGEYGEPTPENDFIARPHYHALIFNHHFNDREIFTEKEGICLYTSDDLDRIWSMGFTTVGDLTFESAAYTARYVMKKINNSKANNAEDPFYEHYRRTDYTTGEIIDIEPEYATMSRGGSGIGQGGIGKTWFDKYRSDCYPSDSISVRGTIQKPPKYYDYLVELDQDGGLNEIKERRVKKALENRKNNTPERLATREIVKMAQTKMLKRSLSL